MARDIVTDQELGVIGQVVATLMRENAHTATKILGDKSVVRATRKLLEGRIDHRYAAEVILTFGRPNFKTRQYIKDCRKAGEPFPIRQVWLQFPPKKRKRK